MFVINIAFCNNSKNVSWLFSPLYFLSDYAPVNVQNATKPSSAKSMSCEHEWIFITSSVFGARAAIVRYSLEMSMFCRTVICSVQTTMSFLTNSSVLQITNRKRLLIHQVRVHEQAITLMNDIESLLNFLLIFFIDSDVVSMSYFLAFVNSNLALNVISCFFFNVERTTDIISTTFLLCINEWKV